MRRLSNFAAVSVLVLLSLPSSAFAQTCRGAASFRVSPFRAGAIASIADGGKLYGAQFAYGHKAGAFGAASIAKVEIDGAPENETMFGVEAGFSAPLGQDRKTELCPVLSLDFESGPDVDATGVGQFETSGRTLALGASIGSPMRSTPTSDIIPFASALYTNATVTLKGSALGQSFNVSVTDDFLDLTAGAGFIMNKVFTIQPSLSYPIGMEDDGSGDSRLVFNILLSYNFGSAGTRAKSRR